MGNSAGNLDLREEQELPARQLGTEAEIEVFGQGVVLPATGLFDAAFAPDAGRAVEIEEATRAVAGGVLDDQVTVEKDRLDLGQQRVVAIQVTPAHLHHTQLGVGEMVDGAFEDVRRGHKVGV